MNKVECPKCCGEMNEGAMVCHTCRSVVDWKAYIIDRLPAYVVFAALYIGTVWLCVYIIIEWALHC